MMPARFAPILFGFLLSGMMSLLVSGVATLRALGFAEHFLWLWFTAWLPAWAVAFPSVLVVAPFARKLVAHLTARP